VIQANTRGRVIRRAVWPGRRVRLTAPSVCQLDQVLAECLGHAPPRCHPRLPTQTTSEGPLLGGPSLCSASPSWPLGEDVTDSPEQVLAHVEDGQDGEGGEDLPADVEGCGDDLVDRVVEAVHG
jgi:hypothetical protein